MPTEAEIRRRKKQDATRKRVAIFLDLKAAKLLDKLRGRTVSRVAFLRELLRAEDQRRY